MSSKTGQRATGRKPTTVRRQSAKTDGAFGKETVDQIKETAEERNVDKTTRRRVTGGSAGSGR